MPRPVDTSDHIPSDHETSIFDCRTAFRRFGRVAPSRRLEVHGLMEDRENSIENLSGMRRANEQNPRRLVQIRRRQTRRVRWQLDSVNFQVGANSIQSTRKAGPRGVGLLAQFGGDLLPGTPGPSPIGQSALVD